jgi:hypothetical protein
VLLLTALFVLSPAAALLLLLLSSRARFIEGAAW